ncbi:MAG: hypothetical protein ACE5KM_06420 [Planctomycetaceae bacterium]
MSAILNREEYIEQAYFFRTYLERLEENMPSQEVLENIREEVLTTTKLPMAIDFLRGEILLTGRISDGMQRLNHYFRAFQTYVMSQAEQEKSRFDQRTALQVLQREAEFLAESPGPAGLFVYQFECIARNRLGYDGGMTAMAADPHFSPEWSEWILKSRLRLGTTDFADMIYYRSEHFVNQRRRKLRKPDYRPDFPILFAEQEGRIARANRGKDPLFMFAALQRQLGHPAVPRAKPKPREPELHPALEARLQRLEARIQLLESEAKGELDLSRFLAGPPDFSRFDDVEPAGNP